MASLKLLLVVLVVVFSVQEKLVRAQVHHVVGGDSGWNPSSNLHSWSSGRVFNVGDKMWFTYAAINGENIVELGSMTEYLSCDVKNPIKMYTNGFNKVSLDKEGIRYFASGNLVNCKNGLKLHVHVLKPQLKNETLADGPTTPSSSTQISGLTYMVFVGLFICFMGL